MNWFFLGVGVGIAIGLLIGYDKGVEKTNREWVDQARKPPRFRRFRVIEGGRSGR